MCGSENLVRLGRVSCVLARADVAHELGTWFASGLEMIVLNVHRLEETAIQTARLKQHHLVSAETLEHSSRCYEVIMLLTRNVVEECKKLWYIPAVKTCCLPRAIDVVLAKTVTQTTRCVQQRYNRMCADSGT